MSAQARHRPALSVALAVLAVMLAGWGLMLSLENRGQISTLRRDVAAIEARGVESGSARVIVPQAPGRAPPSVSGESEAQRFRALHKISDETWAALKDLNRSWIASLERARSEPDLSIDALATARWEALTKLLADEAALGAFLALERGAPGPNRVSVTRGAGKTFEATPLP